MSLHAILTLFLLAFSSQALLAADAAERSILGFSSDGRYFAFEQFGVQDGSGFPYAEIFIIDLETDSWAEGTPIRVRLEDEGQSLEGARRKAKDDGRRHLQAAGIEDNARVLASNSVYQEAEDPRQMIFRSFYTTFGHLEPVDHEDDNVISLQLEEVVLPTPEGCPVGDTPMAGFVLKAKRGSQAYQEVHRDTKIPSSRGCPLKYSLSDAVVFSAADGQTQRMVVLVNVFSLGFEGADRRFLAVPVK
jgi:predicted secreted protein